LFYALFDIVVNGLSTDVDSRRPRGEAAVVKQPDPRDDRLGSLFEDLEQQAAALELEERDAELVDRVQGEYAAVTLGDRVHASLGRAVRLTLHGGEVWEGTLARAGADWLEGTTEGSAGPVGWLVRIDAVCLAAGLSPRALPVAARPAVARLGFSSALRRFAEAVGEVRLLPVGGPDLEGRVVRVGADFVEVDQRSSAGPIVVAFSALRAVRSAW
jgi:hypothetical protein